MHAEKKRRNVECIIHNKPLFCEQRLGTRIGRDLVIRIGILCHFILGKRGGGDEDSQNPRCSFQVYRVLCFKQATASICNLHSFIHGFTQETQIHRRSPFEGDCLPQPHNNAIISQLQRYYKTHGKGGGYQSPPPPPPLLPVNTPSLGYTTQKCASPIFPIGLCNFNRPITNCSLPV